MEALLGLSIVVLYLLFFAMLAAIYIAPTYIAFKNEHPNRWAIMAVNIGLGGTGIGWIASLVWALNKVHLSPTGSNGGESGLNIFANDPFRVSVERPNRHVAEMGDTQNTNDDDPIAKLATLKKLHDQGLLDEKEFRRIRQPYLDRLFR